MHITRSLREETPVAVTVSMTNRGSASSLGCGDQGHLQRRGLGQVTAGEGMGRMGWISSPMYGAIIGGYVLTYSCYSELLLTLYTVE